MRIAFYAPLKPPDHPVPSGDRNIARALMQALAAAGHDVVLASRLRSLDSRGDEQRQRRLHALGDRLAWRVAARLAADRAPDVWFTYHVHHKAPDLLGPIASRALRIPYVIAEASIATKQRDGRWSGGYMRARAAIRAADLVVSLNPADVAGVAAVRPPGAAAAALAPFIDVARFAGPAAPATCERHSPVRLITVAMMRERAKLASYRVLANALETLQDLDWRLAIVGDGPARTDVEATFAPLRERITFLGAREPSDIATLLRKSDVFLWPAIDEAIGLVFLEAQACGVPVVGAATPGVAGVVASEQSGLLVPVGDVAAFAAATRRLVADLELRSRMSAAGFAYVRAHHDIPQAAAQLDALLRGACAAHRVAA
jgi:glycosyltransferase involved in cell wall biosynthesis